MTFDFTIFLYIGIALISARLLGELFERIKLSSILGELFAGFLFGGPIFELAGFHGFNLDSTHTFSFEMMKESIEPLAQIGILFLLFIVGSEIKTSELRKAGKRNLFISLIDVTITYGLGLLISFSLFNFTARNVGFGTKEIIGMSAFFALIFVPTSIGTTVRTLGNMKKLNSKEGQTLLSLAVFDDFLGLLLLLVVSGILFSSNSDSGLSPAVSIILQVTFIIVLIVVILYLLPKMLEFFEKRFSTFSLASTSYFSVGIILAILLVTGFFAEFLGVSAAIGAFLLGVGMQRNRFLMSVPLETFTKIGEGAFIPLFFFSVGSSFILEEFNPLLIILIPLIIISKVTGSFTGAMFSTNPLQRFIIKTRQRFGKNTETESDPSTLVEDKKEKRVRSWWDRRKPDVLSSGRIALGMMPKGEITLVIAAIGLSAGLTMFTDSQQLMFFNELYSVVILLVLITVFLTPLLLRLAFRSSKKQPLQIDITEE